MKHLQLLRIVCLLLLLFEVKDARSNHIAGAELTYEYTGNPNEYLVSVKFYRDCNGIPAPNSVYICLESIALGISTNYIAPLITSTIPQPDPCAPILNYCQGVPGEMEVYYYEVLITVPLPSNDWTLRSADQIFMVSTTKCITGLELIDCTPTKTFEIMKISEKIAEKYNKTNPSQYTYTVNLIKIALQLFVHKNDSSVSLHSYAKFLSKSKMTNPLYWTEKTIKRNIIKMI